MKKSIVRDLAATILIFGHILAISLVFFVLHDYFSEASEKMEIALILAPLTGFFATAALKSIFNNQNGEYEKKTVSLTFSLVVIFIPLVFIAMIVACILLYPFQIASDPQSLKITISAIEVALGGLLGLISEELFEVPPRSEISG
ncbi:hypothetical protein GCE9029_00066 [Grimontia celer]|uniref:Uncharacterized protein n=1 Tax=Grimontia celer TaxID=1796497 RepID=A0A128ERJ2_9GAMM|nr:hypothetical protein [Grimontia celer]CZF77199.1 hypothetical protein GCE9029_00066 [Grimontia celer]